MTEELKGPNYEIRHKNFQGSLPIQVTIDDSDIYTDKDIPTYYVMQPRMSYLFLLTPQINEFYAEYLDMYSFTKDDFWYSYKGQPLRFDIPLGVIYDTLAEIDKSNNGSNLASLPFKITFHYRNFPSKSLQKGMVKYIYSQALKESSMVRTGKASDVSDKLDHVKSMLNAIKDSKYDDFWRFNEELGEHTIDKLKFFPVRVVLNKNYHPYMSDKDKEKAKQEDKVGFMMIQRPVKVIENTDICIGEYLTKVLPKYFHIQTEITVEEDSDQGEGEQSKAEDQPDKKSEDDEIDYVEKTHKDTYVIVNGLQIELDISLNWLILNLSAMDNFLYVTVKVPK